jgi:hypothetical protein
MKPPFKQIFRWLKYPALILGIAAATVALVAYGRGYFYDLETGKIAGGGLLSIDSEPSDARIRVDDSRRGSTENRIRLASGTYTVELRREGYRSWTKELSVQTAAVTYARYPVLVPNKVPSEPIRNLSGLKFVSQSDDQQYLAAVTSTDGGDRVRIFPADGQSSYLALTPSARYPGLDIGDVSWAPDASRAFVRAETSSGAKQYFVFNPGSKRSGRVVETIAGEVFRQPIFSRNGQAIYGITGDNVLRRLALNQSPPRPIAANITDFDVYQDAVYALQQTSGGSRLVRIEDGETRSLSRSRLLGSRQIEAIQHQGQLHLVLHNTDRAQVTLIAKPASQARATISLPPGAAEQVTISPGGGYVVMYSGSHFTTYDLKRQQTHRFQMPDMATQPQWYTKHHLLAVSGEGVILFEFDGANQEYLTVAQDFRVFGNHQQEAVYSIRRNQVTNQLQLRRSNLQ